MDYDLNLSNKIIMFLDNNRENVEVRKYFAERRLRTLTCIGNEDQCIGRFYEILRLSD